MIIEQKLEGEHRFDMIVPIAETFKQDGSVNLKGIGSTTDQSLSRHKMEESAIADMKEQAVGLAGFLNHDPDQVFGQITGVEPSDLTQYVPIFTLLTDHANPGVVEARDKILHWLDNNMSIGLSIGGLITEAKLIIEEDQDGNITNWFISIQHIKLLETSVTPIPAVWETKGTVKRQAACYGPICHQMVHSAFKQELEKYDLDKTVSESSESPEEDIEIELDENKESQGDNMDEEVKQMLKLLMTEREDRIEKEKAEQAAAAKKAEMDSFKQEILDEVTEKVTETIKEDMLTKDDLKEFVNELRGDKRHVQASKDGGKPAPVVEEEVEVSLGGFTGKDITGESLGTPTGEFGHYGGKQVKQMTSLELVKKYNS